MPASMGSLEKENDLRHFFNLARPEWIVPRRRGRSDVDRVIAKLRNIGVGDTDAFFAKIDKNTINEDLHRHGYTRIGKDAIDKIRRKRPFMQQLKDAPVPHVRQVGPLAPARQLLSAKRLASSGKGGAVERSGSSPSPSRRPAPAAAAAAALPSSMSLPILHEAVQTESAPRLRDAPPRKHLGGQSAGLGSLPGFHSGRSGPPSLREGSTMHTDAGSPKVGLARAYSCGATLDSPCADTGASCGDAMSQTWSPAVARKHAGQSETDEYADVLRFHRTSTDMFRGINDRKDACWLASHTMTPLQMGEDMLSEQVALQDRHRLMRTVCRRSSDDSTFRHHVAQNVRSRLQEEARREAGRGPSLSVDQQCTNIKKQLDLMVKARGELKGLRTKVQMVCEGDDDTDPIEMYRGLRSLAGGARSNVAAPDGGSHLQGQLAPEDAIVGKTTMNQACEIMSIWKTKALNKDNAHKSRSTKRRGSQR